MSQPLEPGYQTWNTSKFTSDILPDQIHLWRIRLDGAGNRDEELTEVLSAEEHERALRFHFDQHRNRFIRTHGILRLIFSKYTGIDAGKLTFGAGSQGKPFLESAHNRDIRFNLSHSGDLMILGIAISRELGVDVEVINEKVEWQQIAASYFNAYEMEKISRLTGRSEQLRAFYRVWTMKEAYLKALGDGLAGGLDKAVVNLEPNNQDIFLSLPGGEHEKRRWQVITFYPAAGACGAVVTFRDQTPIKLIQYDWKG